MKFGIRFGRAVKRSFMRLKLHHLVQPMNTLLQKTSYLSELSKWCSQQTKLGFHDFGNPQFRYTKRYDLYKFVLEQERLDQPIDFLEFGVGSGHSFRWWLEANKHSQSRFVGFDTFTGLPAGWGSFKPGAFSTGGKVPEVNDDRARFEKGLFQETLPKFLQDFDVRRRKVVHLDADLYASTLFVLTMLFPYLRPSDILMFDEFGVPTHEFKAFTEFVSAYRVQYEVLGAVNNFLQVAIKLR